MKNFLLLSLLSLFGLTSMAQNSHVAPEEHLMLGEYYGTYENEDGTETVYKVQIYPADSQFPNSLYVANLLPRYQETGSIVYSCPASILSESSVKLELWYLIEGNVDLSLISDLEDNCDLYLFAANVAGDEISLNTSIYDVPMVLSDDGKSITIQSVPMMNALVVAPIVDRVPRGPFVRCVKLPMVLTTEAPAPSGLKPEMKRMYSVYPTVTDGELNVAGFNGTAFIYDMSGNQVRLLDCKDNYSMFDLSELEHGTYILKMNTAMVKIVVQ